VDSSKSFGDSSVTVHPRGTFLCRLQFSKEVEPWDSAWMSVEDGFIRDYNFINKCY
jgi:hypothetical protein